MVTCTHCGAWVPFAIRNTRPKSSVKWPEKLDGNPEINGDDGKLHQADCKRLVEDLKRIGFNDAIDACKAAVEAAGLEYGLDEKKLERLIMDNWDKYCSPHHLVRVLKLAERELIVRKEK